MNSKRVSLAAELEVIRHAVEAVRLIAERLRDVCLDGGGLPPSFHVAISSALTLVEVRLRDLRRVVVGHIDPEQFWTVHTSAFDDADPENEGEDVVFAWTWEQRVHHLRRELTGVRARRRWERKRQTKRGATP